MFIKATRVAFLKNPIHSKEKSSVFWSFGPKQTVEVRPNCTCGQSLDYIHVLYTSVTLVEQQSLAESSGE